jgi:sterol 24-C-methyltransferase
LTKEQVDSFMKSYIIYDLDWENEREMINVLGPDYQKKVGACLSDYYSVLNHLCAIGELEKMYIPPIMDPTQGISQNQILYEKSIAVELQLPPNARLLDLGCGRGRVAAHIAGITGAKVTGINIDADQLACAKLYNEEQNLSNTFVRHDFNELPLPLADNHFDGFYQIQAFSLARDPTSLLREINRVLKPGARLSMLDWVRLPAFDTTNEHHQQLMRNIKPLIGAVGTPTPASMQKALEAAGFRIVSMGNASQDGLQAPLIERAEAYFETAKWLLNRLVALRVLPRHFKILFERLTKDGRSFIEADRARLITTSYQWVAEKPRLEGRGVVRAMGNEEGKEEEQRGLSAASATTSAESSSPNSSSSPPEDDV